MEAIIKLVESIQAVPDELKSELRNLIKGKPVSKHEVILNAGQLAKYIYFIERGLLRAYNFKREREVSAWFMKEGDFVVSVSSFFFRLQARKVSTL